MKHCLFALSLLIATADALKLLEIKREILKKGLHRQLRTNVTFFVEDMQ